jgi:hypothetical protein
MRISNRAASVVITLLLSLAACGFASVARAQEHASPAPQLASPEHADAAADREPHPVLPAPQPWHTITVILIVSLFVCALAVGVMVRLNSWEEEIPPPAHSHDEPPGASHHHGRSGTVNPEPEDQLPHH